MEQKKPNIRRQYGTTAVIFTVIVLLIAIVVNVIAYTAVEKFNLKLDMTSSKIYEITDATRAVTDNLERDVEIIALASEDEFSTNLRDMKEVLDRYSVLSPHLTVTYKDLQAEPALAAQYEQKGTPIESYGLIVKSDLREKTYSLMDMYEMDSYGNLTGFSMEQQITSGIMYVTKEEIPVAAFTQGHNEYMGNTFPTLFDQNNYTHDQITLTVQDIPEDVGLLVIAAPTKDFDPVEIRKLDEFMARGGSLMVFLYPSATELTNLEGFLEEWGLAVGDYVVFEPRQMTGSPLDIVPNYSAHTINQYFSENRYFMLMPQSRNIELLDKTGKTVMPVLESSQEAYGKSGVEFSTVQQQDGDATGPFVLAATSEATVTVDGETKTAKIFLSGSRNMYYDDKLGTTSLANADFLVQVMSWCGEGMEVANVPSKNLTAPGINMTAFVVVILAIVFIVVIPLAILGYGIVVFLRRRNL